METNGFLRRKAYLTKKKAKMNAASNAIQLTLGKMTLVSTRRQQTVLDFPQTQFGTQRQASSKLGMEKNGLRARPALTMKPKARLSAASNATQATIGKIRLVHTTQELRTAQACRQAEFGTLHQA